MREAEVRKLFFVIQNTYSGFDDNDDKVLIWTDLLRDIPFELAQQNLRRYMMNQENKFPPHPGILAATAIQIADGPYIPNAEETRKMLDDMDRLRLKSGESNEIPASARERMIELGISRSATPGAS